MQNVTRVRKHFSFQEREGILQSYVDSQLPQKEFAARAGIGVSTLHAWRKKATGRKRPGGSAFVAVPNLLPAMPVAPAYRLQWPGGLSLEVRAGFAAEELAALLQLLPAL
jgi:transposase-like protein